MKIDIRNKGLKGVFDIEQHCKDNDIDIEKVKELDCNYNELTELKGLDKLINLKWLNGKEYTQPKLDRIDKLINKIERMEEDIAEIKEIIGR